MSDPYNISLISPPEWEFDHSLESPWRDDAKKLSDIDMIK